MSYRKTTIASIFMAITMAAVVSTIPRRVTRSALTAEAEKIVSEGAHISTNNVGQLVELVDRHSASECLARVICELTNNPQAYGQVGQRFAKALMNFRQSPHPRVKYYLDAMVHGAKTKNNAECKGFYSSCGYPSIEIVNVGNRILGH